MITINCNNQSNNNCILISILTAKLDDLDKFFIGNSLNNLNGHFYNDKLYR